MVTSRPAGPTVIRNGRWARWLHAGAYLTVLPLLGTGWWLLLGQEGTPSPLALITGRSDTTLHTALGWALAGVTVLALLPARAVVTFLIDSVRFRRHDLAWFARWPGALRTGRFAWHDGRFDPGQRLANLAILAGLATVIGSGLALALLHGGPAYQWLVPLHRWSTYLLTPALAAHVVIAVGVLPGYRGAWRSMHLGGHLATAVAARLWPGWLERQGRPERDGGRTPR